MEKLGGQTLEETFENASYYNLAYEEGDYPEYLGDDVDQDHDTDTAHDHRHSHPE